MEGKDSIERLLQDLDKMGDGALRTYAYKTGSVALEDGQCYYDAIICDVRKRLHALMPHDKDGREIKVGDYMRLGSKNVDHLVQGFRICPTESGEVVAYHSEAWEVVQPDSWERLEEDAMKSHCDYANNGGDDCSTCRFNTGESCAKQKAVDLVRRAKALAGGGVMAKKAMISQPMAGKTDEEIAEARDKAAADLESMGYEVVNTLFTDEWYSEDAMAGRGVVQVPLCYLAKSLESMSLCHAAYFVAGWEQARGCRIEHEAAEAYGLEVIYGG